MGRGHQMHRQTHRQTDIATTRPNRPSWPVRWKNMVVEILSGRDKTQKAAKSMIYVLLVDFVVIVRGQHKTNIQMQIRVIPFLNFFIGNDFIVQIFQKWHKNMPNWLNNSKFPNGQVFSVLMVFTTTKKNQTWKVKSLFLVTFRVLCPLKFFFYRLLYFWAKI